MVQIAMRLYTPTLWLQKNLLHINSIFKGYFIVFIVRGKKKIISWLNNIHMQFKNCNKCLWLLLKNEHSREVSESGETVSNSSYFKVSGSFQLTLGSEFSQNISTAKLVQGQMNRDKKCHVCVAGATALQKRFWSLGVWK